MKFVQLVVFLFASTAIVACGGSSDAPGGSGNSGASNTIERQHSPPLKAARPPASPRVAVPTGPPPKKMVVRTLKEGRGARIEAGQQFTANFVGVNYKTGKPFETHWGKSAFHWRFGTGEMVKGLEIGLRGMRVGGRRKLIVPSELAYETGALVYLVELLAVE